LYNKCLSIIIGYGDERRIMRLMIAVGILLAVFQLTGCSSSNEHEQQPTTEGVMVSEELVPGYTGGCEGRFTIYSQNQFSVGNGYYGTVVRRTLDDPAQSAGLRGNDELQAVGWFRTGEVIYRDNPEGLRGEVWFYVPNLPNGEAGWVPDAGVRAVRTEHAPSDEDGYFDRESQAALQLPDCELFRH
jgi:hypothetical protein